MNEQSQESGATTAENSDVQNVQNTSVQSAPEEPVVPHKVYAGLQKTLNERNRAFEELKASFATLQEAHEQLQSTAAERMKKLGELGGEVEKVKGDFSLASQRLMKVDAFNQLMSTPDNGINLSPEAKLKLFSLLDKIPAGQDLESTMNVIKEFASFGAEVATERSKRENAGATPGFTGQASNKPQYSTLEEWQKAAESRKPDDLDFWAAMEAFVNQKS